MKVKKQNKKGMAVESVLSILQWIVVIAIATVGVWLLVKKAY